MKSMIKNRSMVNHSIFSRGIKYDYMNILTWTILKKTQILNGCETCAFKYILLASMVQQHICSIRKKQMIFSGDTNIGRKNVKLILNHTGKCIRRFAGIYTYCWYFIDRKW